MDLRRGRRAQGPRLTLKVHAAVASARKSVLGRMAPHPGLEPCLPRRPNSGLIFSLHGIQTCTKQRREHTRLIFLQGGGFLSHAWLPQCLQVPGALAGQMLGKQPLQILNSLWGLSETMPCPPRSWASGVFSAAMLRNGRVHAAQGCGPLLCLLFPSLTLLPCGQWEILGDSS